MRLTATFVQDPSVTPTSVTQSSQRVGAVPHRGPYHLIGQAFGHLDTVLSSVELPQTQLVAIYYDDPATVPEAALRSDAGILLPDTFETPVGLTEVVLPAGRYLHGQHVGPYHLLPEAWATLKSRLHTLDGVRRRPGPSYEIYRNTPMTASPDALVTDIFIPIV